MHEIQAEIAIASTPERVWSILTDFSAYSSWNPFIRSIEEVVEKGKRLTVSIQPVGGKAMTFRPTGLVATPNVELRWLGHFLFRGVFDGALLPDCPEYARPSALYRAKSSEVCWWAS